MFLLENLKRSDQSEDLDIDGKIILEWTLGENGGRMWTRCTWLRIRDRWWALMNTVMNLRVPERWEIS
jgi:hypothetical protein